MTKPSRPTALAALLLACALLSAGFVSHEHDDGDAGGHDHDCVICCVHHHSSTTASTTPLPATPDLAVRFAASSTRRGGFDATLATQATRGPPA